MGTGLQPVKRTRWWWGQILRKPCLCPHLHYSILPSFFLSALKLLSSQEYSLDGNLAVTVSKETKLFFLKTPRLRGRARESGIQNQPKTKTKRARKMIQWSKAFTVFPTVLGSVLSTHPGQLAAIYNSSSRGADALWPL